MDGELSPNTIKAREYRVGFFVRWCEGANNNGEPRLTNLNEISGRDILRYKNWRKAGINKVTLRTQLSDLRQFLSFCTTINAVPESIVEKVELPVLERGENERETYMDHAEAMEIIDFLETYEYASLNHVLFLLTWQTGARISGLHSLDVGDIDFESERLAIRHRPDEGTRLKNGPDGERVVALPTKTINIVRDYMEVNRLPVTDDHGRKPLFTSEHGRMHKNYLPKRLYQVTRPCHYAQECPADKDPFGCEYTGAIDDAVACPHNTRPHDIRRGAITHWLRQDVPETAVSDRMNVSEKTLDRHYDQRTDTEKAEQRRQYLDDL
ncbi:site-specific integrase [Halomicrobium sp. LC1Hm]|uniref:tyrosine-type recombinase/integrase n=1 Tax=Halomicrobium sp. LC1Hm TaxID=2610902 RepID=UPI001885DF78|nr:site-specific integrase [Halomicrobium sp. LC1Hm]